MGALFFQDRLFSAGRGIEKPAPVWREKLEAFHETGPAQYPSFFQQSAGTYAVAHQSKLAVAEQLAQNSPSELVLRASGRAGLLTKGWGPR